MLVDLHLIHDGHAWIAHNDDVAATGSTLESLDRNLVADIAERIGSSRDRIITLRMHFDLTAIPQWMRQYSNHYFNRIITVELPPDHPDSPGDPDGAPAG